MVVGLMPLPGYQAVPVGWATTHRPTAESAMTTRVDLTRTGPPGDWSPTTGPTSAVTAPYATGVPARVQRLASQSRGAEAAGQDVTTGTYLVAVPMAVPPVQVGDRVTVTDNPADEHLIGRVLTVDDVTYGSTPWQRDLVCTLDQSKHPTTTGG